MNPKIQKRQYLIKNLEYILTMLGYYKTWSKKIRSSESRTLWTQGQEESYCKIHEIT